MKIIFGETLFRADDDGEEHFGLENVIGDFAAELASVVARHRYAAATGKERAFDIFKIN